MYKNISEPDEDLLWRPLGRHIISLAFVILLFSSCAKNNSNNVIKKSSFNLADNSETLKEAKYADIPIPVGYRFVDLQKDSDNSEHSRSDNLENSEFLCCYGNISMEQLLKYYRTNMERCGWEIVDLSNEYEGLFFCDKPGKYCVISVRNNIFEGKSNQKINYVCLFIKNKVLGVEIKEKDINSRGFSPLNFS